MRGGERPPLPLRPRCETELVPRETEHMISHTYSGLRMSTGRSGGSANTFRNQSAAAPVAASGSLRRSPYARAGPATALPSIPNKRFRRETNPRCRPSLSTTRVLAARHSRPATFVESARRRPALAGPGGFDRKMGAPVRVRPSNRLLKSVPPRLAVNVYTVERLRLLRFKAE